MNPDNIPAVVLKTCTTELAAPAKLFQYGYSTGIYRTKWKNCPGMPCAHRTIPIQPVTAHQSTLNNQQSDGRVKSQLILCVLFADVQSLEELAVLSVLPPLKRDSLEDGVVQKIEAAQRQLVKELALQEWLCTQGLEHYYQALKSLGCSTLTDLVQFDDESQVALTAWGYFYGDDHKFGRKILQISRWHLEWEHKLKLVHNLAQRRRVEKWSVVGAVIFASSVTLCTVKRDLMFIVVGGIAVSIIAFFFTAKFLYELVARVISFLQNDNRGRQGNRTIYDYVRGNYLDPRSCQVTWDWKDPQEVGHIMTFKVHANAQSYGLGRKSVYIVTDIARPCYAT
ncbi:uncharacterized protein [Heterodontus francisci]|uniref:uncharacterized protein n=1 Tax=Heterodontus francisci TaxID=7792 RepID=UPI00355C0204